MISRSFTTAMIVLAATAVLASACGRRPGQLDTPYQAAVDARKEAGEAKEPLPPEPRKPASDRPFFLDKLIK